MNPQVVQTPANQTPVPAPQPVAPATRPWLKWLLIIIVFVIAVGGVYYWQHKKVNDANAHLASVTSTANANSQKLIATVASITALPNTVKDTAGSGSTVDLAAFLGADQTGCSQSSATPHGWFTIIKETGGNMAKMQYGCVKDAKFTPSGSPTYILATQSGGTWSLISPTNQWVSVSGTTYPTCTMINNNKFTKQIEPKCATPTSAGATTYNLQDNTNP